MWLRVGVCVSVCVCTCTDSYLIHRMIVTFLAVVVILRLLCVGPNQFLTEKKMYVSSYNRLHTIGYSILWFVKRSCLVWGTRASFASQNRYWTQSLFLPPFHSLMVLHFFSLSLGLLVRSLSRAPPCFSLPAQHLWLQPDLFRLQKS